jgi:hypothetical protein
MTKTAVSQGPTLANELRTRRRVLWGFGVAVPAAVLALWIGVNRVPWLGPIVADGMRSVIGKDAVAKLEDIGYAIQDRVYQYTRKGEKPKAYWSVPESTANGPEPSAGGAAATASARPSHTDALAAAAPDAAPAEVAPPIPAFAPKAVGPVHAAWSAPGDGQWVAIAVRDVPSEAPHMYKTLLHPDKNRSWAEVFVVAMDIRRIDLHLVPGTKEPIATEEAALTVARPGVIPEHDHSTVLAAFNGGFKTEHGKYGMRVGDVTYIAPRNDVCALALYKDDSMRVGSWANLAASEPDMAFWRQTPACMYEGGELHPNLRAGAEKKWGSTLDGETVIRRSAIGVDAEGTTLYMAISNHTTALAIADGMHHAGAASIAQLDVNFSYPKFVLYETKTAPDAVDATPVRQAVALADGFEYSSDEFIRQPARRDFFYITPKQRIR